MKKQWPIGLVVEGNITHSSVLRMPRLVEDLGPIKSATVRVARRVSNFLKAGHPVADYEELQTAQLVLIRAPDDAIPRVVEEIFAAGLELKDTSFVLCESWLDLEALQTLRLCGASAASLLAVPSNRNSWFVVEGDSTATRQMRRFIELNGARALELHTGGTPAYFAAELLATALPMPVLLAAQNALRSSGISGNNVSILLNEMVQSMFRDIMNGARGTWGGPLAECSEEVANRHIAALQRSDPQIAEVINHQLEWARCRMTKQKVVAGGPGATQ
jgi:predicted short-subunit dehydrogenase-like oxidoreductase (DUF2520 family)